MKRKLVIVVSMLMFASVIPGAAIATDWWSMFHHDLENSGFSTSIGPNRSTLIWTFDIGDEVEDSIRSSPAVVDDVVYFGADNGNVYGINALTGEKLFQCDITDDPIRSSLAVVDGNAYFGANDGNFYCLDVGNGIQSWNQTLGGRIESAPAVTDGKVYIGSNNKNFYCLDAEDGEILWTKLLSGKIFNSPAFADGNIYVGTEGNIVHCLKAKNGKILWNSSVCSDRFKTSSAAVADDKLYIGNNDDHLYCFNIDDGTTEWSTNLSGDIRSSPAVAYGNIYVGSHLDSDNEGYIYCLNAITGTILWNYSLDKGVGKNSPAIADEKVYIGSLDSYVYCLDANDGTEIWSYKTDGEIRSSSAIANGILYVASSDGQVYAFADFEQPPSKPVISGPTAGGPGIVLNFTVLSTDPDGDQIYYKWDWGDGNVSDWLGPYESGEVARANHSWSSKGDYEIKAKAKDEKGLESDWSDLHLISIAKQIEISNIKPGFVYLRLLSFNRSYAYIYALETLGVAAVIGNSDLQVEATASDAVDSVKIEAFNAISGDQVVREDNDGSDGFSSDLNISTGIWQLTVYAYDEHGSMIDNGTLDYVVFLNIGSSEEPVGRIAKLRHRLRNRHRLL